MNKTYSDLTVLYVQRRTHQAGAQVCLCQFVPHLSQVGIRPMVVAERPGFVTDYLSSQGVPVLTAKFPPWRSPLGWHAVRPFFFRRLRRFLRVHAPDGVQVVHGNDVEEGGVTVAAARMLGSRCVLHIRDQAADLERVRKYRGLEADGIIVLSQAKYAETAQWSGVRALTRILDCIDPAYYRFAESNPVEDGTGSLDEAETLDKNPSLSGGGSESGAADRGYVLIVGGGAPLKGWTTMARALALMGPEARRRCWLFLGRAEEERVREIRAVLETAGTPIDYTFLGHCREVGHFYRAAELVVMPSLQESFSRVVIEAGLFGRPLVASRVGIAEELIGEDEAGYLCEPGDPHGLATVVQRALNDPDNLRRASLLHERVAARCSVPVHNAALRSFYDMVREPRHT